MDKKEYRAPKRAHGEHSKPDFDRDIGHEPQEQGLIIGRNPVLEALKAGKSIDTVYINKDSTAGSGSLSQISRLAAQRGIVVKQVNEQKLTAMAAGGVHQGVIAVGACAEYVTIEQILRRAKEKNEPPFIIICDEIEDPHNLGAIIRSSECAGAHGVVIPERRAAGLTPACEKAAAGALAHMPVARVKNLNRALEELKRAGLWVVAAALEGENALTADLSGPLALVIGSEGEGISHLTLSLCDRRVTLPMLGKISSLNASVAAGVLLYQVVRARGGGR